MIFAVFYFIWNVTLLENMLILLFPLLIAYKFGVFDIFNNYLHLINEYFSFMEYTDYVIKIICNQEAHAYESK